MESFKPRQVLIPVIQLDAHDITENPSKTDAGRWVSIFPLDFEVGKEYVSLSEKNVCLSACVLALFQLHSLYSVQCTSTLLSDSEGVGDKECCALPRV